MTAQTEEIIRTIRALPKPEQYELFDTLAEDMECEEVGGEEISPEYEALLIRRTEEVRSGLVKTISWEEIRDNARRKYGHQ